MLHEARRTTVDLLARARGRAAAAQTGLATAWEGVDDAERVRLRNHALALAGAGIATWLTLALGMSGAGALILAEVVIFVAAWFGGLWCGVVAALTAVVTARVAAVPMTGVPIGPWVAVLLGTKGMIVAGAAAALASRAAADSEELGDRERHLDRLAAELQRLENELADTKASSAEAQQAMSNEADAARTQLMTLQSITDPSLNTLREAEQVMTLLDRLRAAVGADGVALCAIDGRTGRIFSSSEGVAPLGAVKRTPAEFRDHQSRRTSLIHNDASRVADASLCGWPSDVTSLIAVPVVQAGRLQLVVEVANRQGRRSTEWELALIQVVAERVAGLLRQDPYGAVA